MNFKGRDIISITDLTKQEINHILQVAEKMKKAPKPSLLKDYVMASLFYEPSTRTRLSFETAAERLGMSIIGFAEAGVSSTAKGESLHDSIKNIGLYADVIAMRHPAEGSARLAAEATDKPVINGGDGANQHPTQTLLDLFSIKESQKKLTGLSIALVGDLKFGRTTHSLAQALAHYDARLYFVAPDALQMPMHIQQYLKERNIKFSLHDKIESVINKVDIIYMTRIQKERFPDPLEYERVKNVYVLSTDMLEKVKPNMKVMHPLPRVNEIDPAVDNTKYAYYFQQAENGLFARQAVLSLVLGKVK
ncbi:MAG: aspartate carbamoyltransferase [Candidatus Kerfeldbacteria bacterium]